MPDWRTSARGMKGTIFYNESNFVEIIHKYSQKDQWDALSKDAIAEANKYKPELTIRPLIRIIEKEE
jgi:hypothetical protein